MTAFTETLYSNETGYVEFLFNGYYTGTEMKFHIICDIHFNTHRFVMHHYNDEWKISKPGEVTPALLAFERQLSRAIIEHNGAKY